MRRILENSQNPFFCFIPKEIRWIGCFMWVIESVKKGKTSRWYKKVETSVVFIKKMHTFIVP